MNNNNFVLLPFPGKYFPHISNLNHCMDQHNIHLVLVCMPGHKPHGPVKYTPYVN